MRITQILCHTLAGQGRWWYRRRSLPPVAFMCGRRFRLPLEFLHFNPVHCWPLVGQAVSPANPRWTRASRPGSTPVWQKPGCFLYSLWSARSDSNDGGNDRNSRPAKTAARFVPGFGLRFWRSILSALSSAQGRGPEGESANARGSAFYPGAKTIETPFAVSDQNGIGDQIGNPRVPEPKGARCTTIQDTIAGHESVSGSWVGVGISIGRQCSPQPPGQEQPCIAGMEMR